MTYRAGQLAVIALLHGCGAQAGVDAGGHDIAVPRASGRRIAEAPSATAPSLFPAQVACKVDTDCPQAEETSSTVSICEAGACTPQSRDALFDWARRFPEIAALVEAASFADVAWAREQQVSLFVDARALWSPAPAKCVEIAFERSEGTLAADVPERFGVKLGTHDEWFTTIVLDDGAIRRGSFRTTLNANGSVGSVAEGRFYVLGSHLAAPTEDALSYRGSLYEASVVCAQEMTIKQPTCTPARCTQCGGLHVVTKSLDRFGATSTAPPRMGRSGGPCVACTDDPLLAHIPRINLALQNRTFVRVTDEGPTFHRQRAACAKALAR